MFQRQGHPSYARMVYRVLTPRFPLLRKSSQKLSSPDNGPKLTHFRIRRSRVGPQFSILRSIP